ncbi:hypothetical protein [Microvirga zambiensis]|uniref:hypothetical protein n=1 Tax=Microvirga zambiensis TaxID=1402137 RepID=UPI001AEFD919|nr:hypothetical protein [Microvirga zambiensis]
MGSSKRASANRTNAQRSTGPRTAEGKTQSRLNAFKHGLAIPALTLPELARDITALAEKMAGATADNPSVLQAAMHLVAAAVDVDRIRGARRELLKQMLSNPEFHDPPCEMEPMPERPDRIRFTMAMRVEAYRAGTRAVQREVELAQIAAQSAYESEVERVKLRRANAKYEAKQRAVQWEQLARFERYERRAVSRRNSAIRAFDEAKALARNNP